MSTELRHFFPRYATCTASEIDACVLAVASEAGELDRVVPGWSEREVALVACDMLEVFEAAKDPENHPLSGCDWLLATLAEFSSVRSREARARGKRAAAEKLWDQRLLAYEQIAASSNRSPALDYEGIYFEAALNLCRRGDRLGLVRQIECIADGLASGSSDAALAMEVLDLAFCHLQLGDVHRGLGLLASFERAKPSDPSGYKALALTLPQHGFFALGRRAAERGLELLRHIPDPDDLAPFLRSISEDLEGTENRPDAPRDAIEDLEDALSTGFDAGTEVSMSDLVRRLVPEVATARVKELPTMPSPETLGTVAAGLRDFLRSAKGLAELLLRPGTPIKRDTPKIGRNDPCPCGSGKKFKKCCIDGASRPAP